MVTCVRNSITTGGSKTAGALRCEQESVARPSGMVVTFPGNGRLLPAVSASWSVSKGEGRVSARGELLTPWQRAYAASLAVASRFRTADATPTGVTACKSCRSNNWRSASPEDSQDPSTMKACAPRSRAFCRPPHLASWKASSCSPGWSMPRLIIDATSFGPAGTPQVVIDWKSDVQPTPKTIDHYRAQIRNYLDMTGTERGLIVLVTSGDIITVTPSSVAAVAA
jgi:hypothetical protein